MSFQKLATEQGRAFERECVEALERAKFTVTDRGRKLPSVEIDIVAVGINGLTFYFTCKGSDNGKRPGCLRTDTLRKAVAEGYLVYREQTGRPMLFTMPFIPMVLLTSHIPIKHTGAAILQLVERHILYDVVTPVDINKLWKLSQLKSYNVKLG